ncbi:MAG: hypothetical protein EKK56_00840 [Flavobacteriaceae bacterium]|nr:MAG: hypothetical protein EKK56_00840 [Flavobacteriaceae bacterium]
MIGDKDKILKQRQKSYELLINHFGTLSKTAVALGTSRQNVARWEKNGIPIWWVKKIYKLTNYELTVEDLRADVADLLS